MTGGERQNWRREDPDHVLPGLGDWEGPLFGDLGVLHDDGDRVECHACGRFFANLGRHVGPAHGLQPDEYRALFGLNAGQGLVGPRYLQTLQRDAQRLRPYWPEVPSRLIGRRGQWQGRRMRLQARLDPENRDRWAEAGRRGAARVRALRAAGQWEPTGFVSNGGAAEASAKAQQRLKELRANADWNHAWRESLRRAHGGEPVSTTCKVCGDPIQVTPRNLRRGVRLVCGPACRAESRRRANLRRWRDNAYARIVDSLNTLPPSTFTGLGERDAALVRLYYGVGAGEPVLLNQLADQFGLSAARVGEIVRLAVARLLGPETLRSSVDACVICGASIIRRGRRPRATCGKVCDTERRRRVALERRARRASIASQTGSP